MNKFGLFLLEIAQEEKQVEIIRQVLHEQSNFNPYNLFRSLNWTSTNGSIGYKDIIQFMKRNKIKHNKFEAICLIRALDCNNNEMLGYSDFLNFISQEGEFNSKHCQECLVSNKVGVDIEYAFWRLLERELEMHRKLEGIKRELIKHHQISLQQAFFYIYPDNYTKNGFLYKHLKQFLVKEWSFDVVDEEIKLIFKRLDKDNDGLVSWEDFALTVLPLHIDKQDQINWMKNGIESMKMIGKPDNCNMSYSESNSKSDLLSTNHSFPIKKYSQETTHKNLNNKQKCSLVTSKKSSLTRLRSSTKKLKSSKSVKQFVPSKKYTWKTRINKNNNIVVSYASTSTYIPAKPKRTSMSKTKLGLITKSFTKSTSTLRPKKKVYSLKKTEATKAK